MKEQASRYEIRTVEDFLSVPAERRAVCIAEFSVWLEVVEQWRAAPAELGITSVESDVFKWVDDDKGEFHFEATVRMRDLAGK